MITAIPCFPTGLPGVQLSTGGGDPAAFALSLAGLEAITSMTGTERQSSADPGKDLPDGEESHPDLAAVGPPSLYLTLAATPPVEPQPVSDADSTTRQAASPKAVSVAAYVDGRPINGLIGGSSDLLEISTATAPSAFSASPEKRTPVVEFTSNSIRRSEPIASPSTPTPQATNAEPAAVEPIVPASRQARFLDRAAPTGRIFEATTPIAEPSTEMPIAEPTSRLVLTKQPSLGPDIRIVLPTKHDGAFPPIAPEHQPARFDTSPVRPGPVSFTTAPIVAMLEPLPVTRSHHPINAAPMLAAQGQASPPENAGVVAPAHAREAPASSPVQPTPAQAAPTNQSQPTAEPTPAAPAMALGDGAPTPKSPVAVNAQSDAPAPDRRDGATPVRLVAREPEAVPPPAGRPITGPAAQVFAAELRRGVRDGRAPGGVELTAATPLAALDPARSAGAQATAPSEPLDMLRADWPGVMVDRIERLRDAVDASDTRIRLVPDALGAIDLSVRREGETVHVHFAAEQAATRAMLQDAAPRLAEAAEARGLKLGQTDIGGGSDRNDRRPPNDTHPLAPAPARTAGTADEDDDDTRIA